MAPEMNPSDYVLFARTIQAKHFKTLFETLLMLVDTNIQWDKDGMKIMDLDNTRVVMIHMKLHASKFEDYSCEEPLITGVNLANLNKLMKTVDNSDTLTFYLDKADANRLAIRVENEEKQTHTEYKLNLLEIEQSHLNIDDVPVQTCGILNSVEFSQIIKKMATLGERVEIQCTDNKLVLKRVGDVISQETIISNIERPAEADLTDAAEIVQGVFSLKYLVFFCKCQSFSENLELYMKNNYPLIMQYKNNTLGELKLCLSPFVEE
jgi:proliferating cell nuclear antigen PCNA